MPEGDTIHRSAIRLRQVLAGHDLTRFEMTRGVGPLPAIGTVIDDVEAVGKNLLVHFAEGVSLRTHMRMSGSWHLYRDGERWRRGAHLARAVVGADSGWVGVCFQAPIVETYLRGLTTPDALTRLGPDLATVEPDLDLAVERAARCAAGLSIADLLLDQRAASGIGNVYKSEICFLHRVDPRRPAESVEPAVIRAMYETANRLLLLNLDRTHRVTHGRGLAVYDRAGQSCPTCSTPVQMTRLGALQRTTFWCSSCQT